MIEIVSLSRCTQCHICVRVCPSNVFDIVPDAAPKIARQDDCQTCYLCEIYCPEDALYVAPHAEGPVAINEEEVERGGLFGSYSRALGWQDGRMGGTRDDTTSQLRATLDQRKKSGP